jgi:Flp pilus assembly protein TadD
MIYAMTPEFRKAEALLAMGRAEEAAALMEAAPSREQPGMEFYRLKGRVLRAANRLFDAETAFRAAIALEPMDAGLMADLATTLLGQKRHKEALVLAREAAAIRPEIAAFHALIGVLAERLGQDGEARAALETARTLAPGDAEPHTLCGFLLLRTQDPKAAEAAFRAALAADPSRAEALRGLARSRAIQGDWVGAQRYWRESLALQPLQRDILLERMGWLGSRLAWPVRALVGVKPSYTALVGLGGMLFGLLSGLASKGWLYSWLMKPGEWGLYLACGVLLVAALPALVRILINSYFSAGNKAA